jgi:hypothetical protein
MGAAVRALRERLGNEAMADLQTFVENAGRQAKEEMLSVAGERFERRLADEVGALRIDMAKEFADVKVALACTRADVKAELALSRAEVLKWSFLFWIGQVAAVGAVLAFLLRTIGQHPPN